MEIREFTDADVLVLAPEGNLSDLEETSAIETRLGAALKAKVSRVVVDCESIAHMSSAAIRVLLMTMRKLDRVSGRLVLCGMNAKVQSAFSISGFDKDFTVTATREEALQRVREAVQPRPAKKSRAKPVPAAAPAPPPAEPAVSAAAAVEEPPTIAVPIPAPVAPLAPAVAAAPAAPVAPVAATPRFDCDALAVELMNGLGIQSDRFEPSATPLPAPDTLAAGILEALQTGTAGRPGA